MNTQNRICQVCGEEGKHSEPTCQSCLSQQDIEEEQRRLRRDLATALLHWADKFAGTWQDGSDAEVEMEELLDAAQNLIPPDGIGENS